MGQVIKGINRIGKKGVVRDRCVHEQVIEKIIGVAQETGFAPLGLTYSPIRGPEGNIEYLLWLEKDGVPKAEEIRKNIKITVDMAFERI